MRRLPRISFCPTPLTRAGRPPSTAGRHRSGPPTSPSGPSIFVRAAYRRFHLPSGGVRAGISAQRLRNPARPCRVAAGRRQDRLSFAGRAYQRFHLPSGGLRAENSAQRRRSPHRPCFLVAASIVIPTRARTLGLELAGAWCKWWFLVLGAIVLISAVDVGPSGLPEFITAGKTASTAIPGEQGKRR